MENEQGQQDQNLNIQSNQFSQTNQNSDLNNESSKKNNGKKPIIIIIIVALLLIASVGGYIWYQNNNTDNPTNTDTENNNDKDNENTETTVYKIDKWNNVSYTPSKSFFTKEFLVEDDEEAEVEYVNLATLSNGQTLVRAMVEDLWWGGYAVYEFLVDDNDIIFLKRYNEYLENKYLTIGIKVDSDIEIPELYPEEDITYSNQTFIFRNHNQSEGHGQEVNSNSAKKLTSTKYGDLYERGSDKQIYNYFYSKDYYLKTPDNYVHSYDLKSNNIYNDDRTLNINWDNSEYNTYSWEVPFNDGCSAYYNYMYIQNFTPSMGKKIGTIKGTNKAVYQLTDETLLKVIYDEYYMMGREEEYAPEDTRSFADYKNNLTALVYSNGFDEYIVLQNSLYSRNAECGKPVIYLYPEKDTYIDVEVNADVTVSDPLYIPGGWKNVLAKPDGTLIYQGNQYDSLFWEGKGNGTYPNIDGIGKVVTQQQLIPTIKKDLKAQGLNAKEIADFLEFWQDNLPTTPYVKLYWFTTEEMNELAPLKVSPKPDTVIRVFLDARGLSKPIELKEQKFTKVERKGFTLVEWGGLLVK